MRATIKKATLNSQKNTQKMTLEEAIRVLRAVEVRSPWSAYELLVKTAVMRGRPVPRGQLELPRDPRTKREIIAYFVEEGREEEALKAGANYAGSVDLIEKILSGEVLPTKVFSTPGLLPVITPKLGRFLGPKNLMPSIKKGTVSEDIASLINDTQGSFDWKGDRSGVICAAIARMNFAPEEVIANIKAFMKSVHENSRDPDEALTQRKSKKMNSVSILSVRLSSRQGPGIELQHV
ncbi:ribosomal protein L1 [Serendipita vermifera]|nr:ribosomal protein L1 [Serendipita vermifera]